MALSGRISACLALVPFLSLGQIQFEPGYFITNDGQRVDCLIRNEKWKNNPAQIQFKREATASPETGTVEQWKEFGLVNGATYQRSLVALDRSSTLLSDLETQRMPSFERKTAFLLRLIQGKASLFVYEESTFERYFLRVEGDTLVPLVYKVYRTPEGAVGRNEMYKGQLRATLNCAHVSEASMEGVKYNLDDLAEVVNHFNVCQGGMVQPPEMEKRRAWLSVHLRAGTSSQQMKVESSTNALFDRTIGPGMSTQAGLEGELHLPSRGNRWALVFGASYQYFSGSVEILPNYPMSVEYHSVDISLGARYFFHLNERSRFFLNAGAAGAFDVNSEFLVGTTNLGLRKMLYLWVGAGYQRGRWGLELRYVLPRDPLEVTNSLKSTLSGTPYLYAGYRIN